MNNRPSHLEEDSKKLAKLVFGEELGFTVKDLPLRASRTADLYVRDGSSAYLVEAAEKKPSWFFRDLQREAYARGYATKTRKLGVFPPLGDLLRNKIDQLAQTASLCHADFSIVLLACFNKGESEVLQDLLERTVFGAIDLTCLSLAPEAVDFRRCFHFEPSIFADEPGLDAVLFATPAGGCLFSNCRGAKAEAFRRCQLYRLFAEAHALVDPGSAGNCATSLSLPVGGDQWSLADKQEYLRSRFGVRTSPAFSSQFLGLVAVPVTTPDSEKAGS